MYYTELFADYKLNERSHFIISILYKVIADKTIRSMVDEIRHEIADREPRKETAISVFIAGREPIDIFNFLNKSRNQQQERQTHEWMDGMGRLSQQFLL